MKVALRVDASARIGLGHLRRCLSLAQALRSQGAQCRFVWRELGVDVHAHLHAEGFAGHRLPSPGIPTDEWLADAPAHAHWAGVPAGRDASETVAALAADPPDCLVVDHYAFDAAWHRAVRAALGCRMAAIDDLGDRDLAVDLLIDHNHAASHRAKYAGRLMAARGDDPSLLGGPRYALLGPAFAAAPRCAVATPVQSIGVFMGGADPGGASAVVLQAIAAAGFEAEVEVVSTTANPQLAALHDAVARRPQTLLRLDLPDLTGFFARHDLQVGAGGGATWERCCIGAPTLAVVLAENQRQVLEPLAGLGVLQAADATVRALTRGLRQLIEQPGLRAAMAARARLLVDGRGAERVASHLLDMP